MRFAFGIVSLFPGGGLQRDCLEIARLIRGAGHEVVIYTSRIQDDTPTEGIPIVILRNSAKSNHQRQYIFALDFQASAKDGFDLTIGFDKLIGVDLLYCADASMGYRMLNRPYLYLFPRYRTFCNIEGASFLPGKTTKIILLSQNQLSEYRRAWRTEPSRLLLLPPTVSAARREPELRIDGTRERVRAQLGLRRNDWVWLTVGVQPKTKGFDRAIRALITFPDAHLLIAGLHETDRAAAKLVKRARSFGVSSRIAWLGHREDIPDLMSAADLLVHPARYDTTGTVVLEAIVNGLPVVTTSVCGYAAHVDAAQAGIVLKASYDLRDFLAALAEAQDSRSRGTWLKSGVKYGRQSSLYEGRSRAAEIILASALKPTHHTVTPFKIPRHGAVMTPR